MVAVSSFRPLWKCTPEIAQNQFRACLSWQKIFQKIVYFNRKELCMDGPDTLWIPVDEKPRIKDVATVCSKCDSWACIINADIVVTEELFIVEDLLRSKVASCGISLRYDLETDRIIDNGLDFFCARDWVWKLVANQIPDSYTLGRIVWDTWMLSFFTANFGKGCYDLSRHKFIYHPKHFERCDQNFEVPKDFYLSRHSWPYRKL